MNTEKIKIIFAGTPEFSVPFLQELVKNKNFSIELVISSPDKAVGRGLTIKEPAVKTAAKKLGLPIKQPIKIKELENYIKRISPDLILVVAYGQLIPKSILQIPKYGCVNVHGSLLPKYRGSACIQAPILNGDTETGITFMDMNEGLDTGDIISQVKINLNGQETAQDIHDTLSQEGSKKLATTLINYIKGVIKTKPQDETQASYCRELKKGDGRINWNNKADFIEKMVRAYHPWPHAFTSNQDGKIIKILSAEAFNYPVDHEKQEDLAKGKVFIYNEMVAVECGQGFLVLKKIQLEGKKALDIKDFVRGHTSFIDSILL